MTLIDWLKVLGGAYLVVFFLILWALVHGGKTLPGPPKDSPEDDETRDEFRASIRRWGDVMEARNGGAR